MIGDICLFLAILAKLSGGKFATINPGGYIQFAGTIFLGTITLGVYNILRRVEIVRPVKDKTAHPERLGPEEALEA